MMLYDLERRDSDFLRALGLTLQQARHGLVEAPTLRQAIRLTLRQEAPAYYVDREYACRRLSAIRRHKPRLQAPVRGSSQPRRLLWQHLDQAVARRQRLRPSESLMMAADHVLMCEKAPQYYMTELYAEKRYYSLRHDARQQGILLPSAPPAAAGVRALPYHGSAASGRHRQGRSLKN